MRTTASPQPRDTSEIAGLTEKTDHCLLQIAADGRIVGVITDPDICATGATKSSLASITDAKGAANRVFCCKRDEEVRAALKTTLNCSKVDVEVAGGILRHHHCW